MHGSANLKILQCQPNQRGKLIEKNYCQKQNMRKLIAAMNMTLDGFCDHTAMIADDEIHQHYNELLSNAGTLMYGRVTYQLMESYWPSVVKNPTGNKPIDEFAVLIDNISKIVFSRTLKNVDWKNTTLKTDVIKEEVLELKESGNGGSKKHFSW